MKQKRLARWILVLAVVMLAGCRGGQPSPAAGQSFGDTYTSQALDTSYAGALNAYRQLMLGTIRLAGAENAVTPEQARTLLVLWQSFQGRTLQSDAERKAVLAYIETQMTSAQLKAIAAMRLTQDDLLAPMVDDSQGTGLGFGRGSAGQRGASGTPFAPGGRATPQAMVTRQAQPGNPSNRGQPATRATTQPGGQFSVGSGQDMILLNSLIRLLAQRAAEGAATRTPAPTPLSTTAPAEP